MNDHIHLIHPDLDSLIISYLNPSSSLALRQSNKHYASLPFLTDLIAPCLEIGDDFIGACEHGNIWLAQYLYSERIDININLILAFRTACEHGHKELAEWIIQTADKSDNRIYIHGDGEHAFRMACENGHILIAKWLIELGEDSYGRVNIHKTKEYAFGLACKRGHVHIAKWLIELGQGSYGQIDIHIDTEYAFRESCREGHKDIAEWLLGLAQDSDNEIKIDDDVLHSACDAPQMDIIEWLLELRSFTIEAIHTALLVACKRGHLDLAQWFFQTFPILHTENMDYVFYRTCSNGQLNVAQWLLEISDLKGKRIDIHSQEESPFDSACRNGHLTLAQWLIEIGEKSYGRIDIHRYRSHNFFCGIGSQLVWERKVWFFSPFTSACSEGQLEMAQWLLQIGEERGDKIDIHRWSEFAYWSALSECYFHITEWLDSLSESYGPVDKNALQRTCIEDE